LAWTNFKAWMYTGTAIRMAHALQLGSEFNQRHSPRQKEIRRRTFWACFVMDRLISYSNNRPLSIDMVSVRIQLPCPENRFIFEEDLLGLLLTTLRCTLINCRSSVLFHFTLRWSGFGVIWRLYTSWGDGDAPSSRQMIPPVDSTNATKPSKISFPACLQT
jgi:hypothetical protein